MSTWTTNIPQPNDLLSISQPQLLGNTNSNQTIFGTDHFTFNFATVGLRGYHKQVTFGQPLSVNPGQISPIATLYTKLDVNSVPQLFFQNGALSTNVIQITGGGLAGAWAQMKISGGVLTLPSSYNIATSTRNSVSNYTLTFSTPFSTMNYAPVITAFGSGITYTIVSQTASSFQFTTGNLAADPSFISIVFFGG